MLKLFLIIVLCLEVVFGQHVFSKGNNLCPKQGIPVCRCSDHFRNNIHRVSVSCFTTSQPSISDLSSYFKLLPNLYSFRYADNTKDAISDDTFGTVKFENLHLTMRNLSKISTKAFTGSEEIKSLAFAGHNFDVIPIQSLNGLNRLETLSLQASSQGIPRISSTTFENMKSKDILKNLLLIQNKIQTIENGAFQPLINLRKLFLQSNMLTVIDFKSFYGSMTQSIRINLEYNKIKSLPVGLINILPSGSEINIDGNNIKSIPIALLESLKVQTDVKILVRNNGIDCEDKTVVQQIEKYSKQVPNPVTVQVCFPKSPFQLP